MAGEEQEWFYVDSTGQEFGPFPSSTMRGWFQQGFFPMQGDLQVRLSSWTEHQKIGTLYGEPISDTAFDGPPRAQQANRPSPGGGGGGGRKQGGGRGGRRDGGGGGNTGNNTGGMDLPQQMGAYDAMMPGAAFGFGMPGAMMPGLMQGAGLAPYGFPPVRPGGYAGMSPFGGMPMMPPGPGASTGRFVGRIKSFNAQKGFGFIECPEAHAIYGRDVFLHKAQIGDFSTGSELCFSVEMNKSNMPQARDLTEVDQFALAASAMGMGGLNPFMGGAMGMGGTSSFGAGGGNKGGGKGKGGKGKAKAKGKAASKKPNNPEDSN